MDSQSSFDHEVTTEYQGSVGAYSIKDLQEEIAKKIEWLQRNNGATLHPDWITNAVIADHPHISGEDKDFYTCCSRAEVRNETRRQLNRYRAKPDAEPDPQLTLEGFDRLQQYYLVDRDETQVAVRIDQLTDEEIYAKAAEYEAMGRGCFQHAQELYRYVELRRAGAA